MAAGDSARLNSTRNGVASVKFSGSILVCILFINTPRFLSRQKGNETLARTGIPVRHVAGNHDIGIGYSLCTVPHPETALIPTPTGKPGPRLRQLGIVRRSSPWTGEGALHSALDKKRPRHSMSDKSLETSGSLVVSIPSLYTPSRPSCVSYWSFRPPSAPFFSTTLQSFDSPAS